MSRGKTRTIRHAFEYALVYSLFRLARLLPGALKPPIARTIAALARLVTSRRGRIALANLRLVFPESTLSELRAIVRGVYLTLAANALDVVDPEDAVTRVNVSPHNCEQLERCLELSRQGRPLIIATGHIGNWEICGQFMGTYAPRFYYLAQAQSNPYVDRLINRLRLKRGGELVHSHRASRVLPKLFRQGAWVYFVADQDAGADGVVVDFLGVPTSYNRGIGLFSYHYNAPIVVSALVWKELAKRYDLHILGVIEPDLTRDREEEIRRLIRTYSDLLGRIVMRYPDQWLWTHRRWKSTIGEKLYL